MRIIHSSDWHLGQFFYGKSREKEHRAFLNWLLVQIEENQIDALIVAGDIFDTSTPPSYARSLYNFFIVEMQKLHCQLFILGGNHDSIAMLNESKSLLNFMGVQVVAGADDNQLTQIFVINDNQNKPMAVLGAIPFLRPRDLLVSESGLSGDAKEHEFAKAISDYYQQIYALAEQKNQALQLKLPIILTGHLTTLGTSNSKDLREIYVGSLSAFNANLFPCADYIALGHIHRAQKVNKSGSIRYSGSPIPLSFDEINQQKQIVMLDFDDVHSMNISEIKVPRFRQLLSIKGSLDDIDAQLKALICEQSIVDNSSTNVTSNEKLTTWLSVEVDSKGYVANLQEHINHIITDNNMEVLRLIPKVNRENQLSIEEAQTLEQLDITDVFIKRLAQEIDDNEESVQQKKRLTELYQQIASNIEIKHGDNELEELSK